MGVMNEKKGLIHIYFGNGKGKTTAGMGLCARAAGYGYKVLIYQFMKDNTTSERNILKCSENITILDGLEQEKFSSSLTEEERRERRIFYTRQFQEAVQQAERGYDVLFLDEVIYTIQAGLLDEEIVTDYLEKKPEHLEVILTGNSPSSKLIEAADYVSEIKKIKHPFDSGQGARKGIEL